MFDIFFYKAPEKNAKPPAGLTLVPVPADGSVITCASDCRGSANDDIGLGGEAANEQPLLVRQGGQHLDPSASAQASRIGMALPSPRKSPDNNFSWGCKYP